MAKKKARAKIQDRKDLSGFDIAVNEFGELISSLHIEHLNEFLNAQLEDKKNREGVDKTAEEEE